MLQITKTHTARFSARYSFYGAKKRFNQNVSLEAKWSPVASFGLISPGHLSSNWNEPETQKTPKWASHSLKTPLPLIRTQKEPIYVSFPTTPTLLSPSSNASPKPKQATKPAATTSRTPPANRNTSESTARTTEEKTAKPRRQLRPRKALITLTDSAVEHLKALLDQPEPQLIRIGVKNRGCSGLTYNLEYVSEPGKFDETVEQNGVKVLIDSKALFSIVGSEMDWVDEKLSQRFVFKNPNSMGTCGCGESFMV